MTAKTINPADFRLIKRMSDDTTIYVAETNDSGSEPPRFALVQDGAVIGTFEKLVDAYRLYGVLTRAKHQ